MAREFIKNSKEKISFAVEFKQKTNNSAVDSLRTFLDDEPFYLPESFDYNARDSIENMFSPQLEDSLSGYLDLPFRDVVFFNVRESYVNATDLVLIKSKILKQKGVDKVYYEQVNIEQMNSSIKKGLFILSITGAVLILLTFLFLYNTLKMGLNYRSDVIYNQLLLGASPSFVARPMMLRVLLTTVTAAIAASVTFFLIVRFLSNSVEGLKQLWSNNIVIYLGLLTALIVLTIMVFSIYILRKNLRLMQWEN